MIQKEYGLQLNLMVLQALNYGRKERTTAFMIMRFNKILEENSYQNQMLLSICKKILMKFLNKDLNIKLIYSLNIHLKKLKTGTFK